MTTPVTIEFVLPENCPKDIELMSIWAQAAKAYGQDLTPDQMEAAVEWFKLFIDSDSAKQKSRL